jgi:hypothetical protein
MQTKKGVIDSRKKVAVPEPGTFCLGCVKKIDSAEISKFLV